MENIKFAGLKSALKAFDVHGWKGSFSSGEWRIANGGYDLWFELYYSGQPVARCVDGELNSNFGLAPRDKEMLIAKVLEVYDHLKVKQPSLSEQIQLAEARRSTPPKQTEVVKAHEK